jgi:cobalt/nickel transport system ATP-binding protein
MSENIFEIKNAEYVYTGGVSALAGISLEIKKGERVAFMGANGSGKSTLLSLLDGLIFPSKGTVNAFGRELSETALSDADFAKSFRSKTGFVFQNPEVQLFCPTVREDIAFGPLCMGLAVEETEKFTQGIANELGITELLDRPPHRLSIGEKKKVAIATALVMDPEVIIMDEPTAGLDPLTTRHIIDLLIKAGQAGKTVITATHDIHTVEETADIIYILGRDKKITASGTPQKILNNASILMENNLIHMHTHKHGESEQPHAHPHLHDHHSHGHPV